MHSFDQAALALNEDWGTHLDGKQIQRWAEAIGRTVVSARDAEVGAFEQGNRPPTPANAPVLLVIGMDGGRVQTREKTVVYRFGRSQFPKGLQEPRPMGP